MKMPRMILTTTGSRGKHGAYRLSCVASLTPFTGLALCVDQLFGRHFRREDITEDERLSVSLRGGEVGPHMCENEIAGNTPPIRIHFRQAKLRADMPL